MIKHEINKDKSSCTVFTKIKTEEFKNLTDEKQNELAKKVKVPGYRPGKAPLEKRLQYVNTLDAINKVINDIVNKNFNDFIKYIEKNNLPIYFKDYTVYFDNANKKETLIGLEFAILPEFNKVDFKKIKATFKMPKLTEKDVEEEVEKFKENLAIDKEIKDEKVKTENGDLVNIDFKGFINNEAFEGGEAQGYDLKLGSNTFIPGFEDQLIGKKLGYSGDVVVTFPESYFVEEYRNKEAVFQVKINKITRKEKPELNNELISKLGISNVSNFEELKALISKVKEKEIVFNAYKKFEDELIEEILNIEKPVLSDLVIKSSYEKHKKDFYNSLKEYGMKKTEYLQLVKTSEEKLEKEFKDLATKEVSKNLAVEFIIKSVNFKKAEEMEQSLFNSLSEANRNDESLKNIRSLLTPYLVLELVESKALKGMEKFIKQLISVK
ncbi:trigger factor [Mycoplasma leonicaptivi]|uniref:trigger factor n=1 Tax=Mycoplasma leonicaptivi TaxID=36742 RepID=UPI0004811287|nr:trigger factor [Mycoplasma leonicaptivi]